MPDRAHYDDLSLADGLDALADHHYESATRHISRFEYDLIKRAAHLLRAHGSDEDPPVVGGET